MQIATDLYGTPALLLLLALVAVFGALWFRKRSLPPASPLAGGVPSPRRRHLLWLVGWMFAAIQLEIEVLGGPHSTGLWLALSRASMQLAVLMFLGSLAPQHLDMRIPGRLGEGRRGEGRRFPVLYVVAFGAPVILFSTAVSLDPTPGMGVRALLLACCVTAILVAARWSLDHVLVPVWGSLVFVALIGAPEVWLTAEQNYLAALALVHSAVLLMTAALFAKQFRRLTAGIVFTVGGLVGWSLPVLLAPMAAGSPVVLSRVVNLMQVIAAVGMIVLVLEDELACNLATQQRDRRARLEMEKYAELYLEGMPFDEDPGQYNRVCETIVGMSRFGQGAILARSPQGWFHVAGRAGIDEGLERTLDALARRTTDDTIREIRAKRYSTPEIGHLSYLDLRPLLDSGEQLPAGFHQVHAIAIHGREGRLMGALLLAGLRDPEEPLLTEDVLPL